VVKQIISRVTAAEHPVGFLADALQRSMSCGHRLYSSLARYAGDRDAESELRAESGQVRCFNPVFYVIDTVIPLVSLDQRDTWYPDTSTHAVMQWWLDIATILARLLSSIFVLALAVLACSA
jgi:hypothetical protein